MLKGGVLKAYLDFIRSEHGPEALEECQRHSRMSFRDLVDKELYSIDKDTSILTWISSKYGMQELKKLGNHTVKNLGGLAHLVRFANMKFFLRKAKENYDDTFTFGKVSVLTDEFGKSANVIFKDSMLIEESCIAWIGAFEGFLEITRTKGTVEKVKCQLKGDEYCEYKLKWD